MEDFFVCAGSLGFFFILFSFILLLRFISYRETLLLAEKGLVRPQPEKNGRGTLVWGVLLTAAGAALCLGLWPIGFMTSINAPLGFGPWMIVALIPLFFGLGLLLIYVLSGDAKKKEESPAPKAE